jgi:NADPH-dependent ferric siderophore reductase
VADAAEEQDLPATWLHRDGTPDLLARAVAKTTLPEGRVEAWLAGERSSMVALRTHLLDDRGFDRRRVRPTTYWRRGEPGS